MISVYLNNEVYHLKSELSVKEFLAFHNKREEHFAIAINNQFLPRQSYSSILLCENDRIDIIVPMQGG